MMPRNGNGQTTSYTYNEFNDVVSKTGVLHGQTQISYEPKFNKVAAITDPRGNSRSFTYDERGNLLSMEYPDGSSRQFSYTSFGLPATSTDENGNVSQFDYDAYLYDGLGSVAALASANGTLTDRYQYDAFDQLTKTLNSEEDPEDVFNKSCNYLATHDLNAKPFLRMADERGRL